MIHLNNLIRNSDLTSYRTMMKGKPQTLVSKFRISYNLLLNLIDVGDQDFLKFVQRSMIQECRVLAIVDRGDLSRFDSFHARIFELVEKLNLSLCQVFPDSFRVG